MKKKSIIILLSIFGGLVLAVTAWLLYINGAFLPGWINWAKKESNYTEEFTVTLKHKKVTVTDKKEKNNNIISNEVPASSEEEVWHSSNEMIVQDYLIADITGDGENELVLLFWRRGRFGMYRPFFIEKNDKHFSQHIAVYKYDAAKETFDSIWTASDIGVLASDWKYDMSHKRLIIQDRNDAVTVWMWSGFGFALVDSEVSFAVAGDNLIHDTIYNYGLEKRGGNFAFLYENISSRLQEADVRVLNLETILVDKPEMYSSYPAFGTPLEVGEAAAEAGFNVFTCATNHSLDKGMYGIDTTVSFCKEKGITCLGIQSLHEPMAEAGLTMDGDEPMAEAGLTMDGDEPMAEAEGQEQTGYELFWKKGYSFALFNYTMGLSNTDGKYPKDVPEGVVNLLTDEQKEQIVSDIEEASRAVDAVVVFVHWGTEDSGGIDEFQEKWAGILAESGADVIVGTHPHVLQPVEKLVDADGRETLVYYSLGNLVSSQRGEDNRLGGIAEIKFGMTMDGMKVTQYALTPVVTHHGSDGMTTCYYLDDYTDEIASQKTQNLKKEELLEKYNRIRID